MQGLRTESTASKPTGSDSSTVLCPPWGIECQGLQVDTCVWAAFLCLWCVCVCAYVHACTHECRCSWGQRHQIPQAVVHHLMYILGIKRGSSGRAVCAFNHRAVFWSLAVLSPLHVTLWFRGRPSVPKSWCYSSSLDLPPLTHFLCALSLAWAPGRFCGAHCPPLLHLASPEAAAQDTSVLPVLTLCFAPEVHSWQLGFSPKMCRFT